MNIVLFSKFGWNKSPSQPLQMVERTKSEELQQQQKKQLAFMPLLLNFTPGQSHGMSKLLAFIKTHLIFRREYLKMRGERKVHNLLSVTTGGEKRQQARKSLCMG